MGIAMTAPRGGLVETLAGSPRVLILRNAEIERFEDQHKGIFETWDGFMGRAARPTSTEVRDLVALGLVGGGMKDAQADDLVAGLGPAGLPALFAIAQALIGVAFMPDAMGDGGGDEEGESPAKKTQPAPGA